MMMDVRFSDLWKRIDEIDLPKKYKKKLARKMISADKELYIKEYDLLLIKSITNEWRGEVHKAYVRHEIITYFFSYLKRIFLFGKNIK